MNDTQVNYLLVGPRLLKRFSKKVFLAFFYWLFLLCCFLLMMSVENIIIDILCFLFMFFLQYQMLY